jgi:PhnB protein
MIQRTIPYLTIKGAADAVAFYRTAFNAIEEMRMPAPDGKLLLHVSLSINGGTVLLSDEFVEQGSASAPSLGKPSPVAVALRFDTPDEVDATYQRAVAAGARTRMEPGDMFWGDRFAMIDDPFGHRWMLGAPLPK